MNVILFFYFILHLLSSTQEPFTREADTDLTLYDLGKQRLEAGNPQMALKIWRQEFRNFSENGFFNPRIGFEFIQVATYEIDDKWFDEASTYYLLAWQTFDPTKKEFAAVYEEELKRVLLLMPEKEGEAVLKNFKRGKKEVGETIFRFWDSHNEILSTNRNERLIEHWQRIHEARSMYRKDTKSVYGCDARGELYVLYGKPNQRRTINAPITSYTDPSTNSTRDLIGIVANVDHEVWRYFRKGNDDMTFYIGDGVIGKRGYIYSQNIFDVLPNTFLDIISAGNSQASGINSSWPLNQRRAIAQFAALETAKRMDSGLAMIYQDIINEYTVFSAGTSQGMDRGGTSLIWSTMRSFTNKYEATTIQEKEKNKASSLSTLVNSENSIQLLSEYYRVLESDGSTTYLTLYTASVAELFMKESFLMLGTNVNEMDFAVVNTVALSNKMNQIVQKQSNETKLDATFKNVPVFNTLINSKDIDNNVFVSLDILNYGRLKMFKDEVSKSGRHARALMVTTGRTPLELPPVINNKDFAMSDVFISRNDYDEESRFPILPLKYRHFAPGEEIAVFFEIYNIPNEDYTIDLYFNQNNLLQFKRRLDTRGNVRLTNKAFDKVEPQLFTLKLDDLRPGEYELMIEVNAGRKAIKKPVQFIIVSE